MPTYQLIPDLHVLPPRLTRDFRTTSRTLWKNTPLLPFLAMLTLIGPLTFDIAALYLALSSKWLVLPLPGKCRVQPTVSLSSTEAEFLAASDAGKMTLYLRSILDELDIPQQFATVLYEDNRGALLLMASAAQPTKQSRHIEIRIYALLDWVERDLVTLEDVTSGLNSSDILTKQTGPLLLAMPR